MLDPEKTKKYAGMGMYALVPGIKHILALAQRELDEMQTEIAAMEGEGALVRRGRGRPKANAAERAAARAKKPKNPWQSMTKAERSAEMKRRRAVAAKNKAAKLPRVRLAKTQAGRVNGEATA